ncbi:hypothetical protein OAB55_00970 [Flavobacteriaceae bacterium]|nr:hypothetical protein [Flavobacteriaceae bacterium]
MKNIKDITISIFAIIGFAFVLSSFTNKETEETTQQVYGTPESHVWTEAGQFSDRVIFLNKKTGEIRMAKASGYTVIERKYK